MRTERFFWSVVFVATLSFANAFGGEQNAFHAESDLEPQPVAKAEVVECMSWLNPHAETVWEDIINTSQRLALQPRMKEFEQQKTELEKFKFGFGELNTALDKVKVAGNKKHTNRLMWAGALWICAIILFISGMCKILSKKKSVGCAPFVFCLLVSWLAIVTSRNIPARDEDLGEAENCLRTEFGSRLEALGVTADAAHPDRVLEEIEQLLEHANAAHTQAEGQLEAFGTRYMPNAYAQYQEIRGKALELEQVVKDSFPNGEASDPTGNTMFAKAQKNLAMAVARTFRRRDELCFFLLFHQAGIFSEDDLAEYDSRPIIILLEEESADWPDDTPMADTALEPEDATFAAKYLPETYTGYQRLCGLFDEGAKQYADLRRTALALDAPRARLELLMLKSRLEEIKATLQQYKQGISVHRLEHAVGDASAENLAALDHANAVKIQEYERKMGMKAYVTRAAKKTGVTLPGGTVLEMVWCPPGSFMMGSNDGEHDEKPVHQVTLTKGFWMAKTEVTQAQWKRVMGYNPSSHGYNPSSHEEDKLPVVNVSWNDCHVFCQKTGLSLPTEAEWEYACRAGSTGAYGGTGNLEDMGWYSGNSWKKESRRDTSLDDGEIHPVGQKQPNAWGLYDMHGNVKEWCADWYWDYSNGAVTNPTGPRFSRDGCGRVFRGGDYEDDASACRSTSRSWYNPTESSWSLGFRPVVRQD